MAIEIVDFPIKNGGSFHSYVSLPEGTAKVRILCRNIHGYNGSSRMIWIVDLSMMKNSGKCHGKSKYAVSVFKKNPEKIQG